MKSKPYRILFNYGGYEGHSFYEEQFSSAEEALKRATTCGYSQEFLIVKIIEFAEKKDEEDHS